MIKSPLYNKKVIFQGIFIMKLLISFFLVIFVSFANDLKDITSYQASFKQSIINNSGKEILYSGDIYVNQPANILWKYNDPIEKDVYILNNKVTIIEPDLEQAIVSKLEKEINILELIKNATKTSKNKYLSTIYNNDYTLTIVGNKLQKIEYKDNIDNSIVINFSNIKQNIKLPNDIFVFNIPTHYDIIKK